MCDDEISKYYRHLYAKEYPYLNGNQSTSLTRPVWGAHISVIRGEHIPNISLWGIDANKTIEFEYDAGVQSNKEYFWLRARCRRLEEIRQSYGLYKEPKYGLHLTIGRTTENVK